MGKLASMFIIALVPFVWDGGYNIMIDLLNYLIQALGPAAIHVIGLFPANPCGSVIASCAEIIGNLPAPDATMLMKCLQVLGWLLPIEYLAGLVSCLMLSIVSYFTMAPLARWFKLIT